MATSFPDKVTKHVFSFINSNEDRNAVSLVCKAWYEMDRLSRRRVFIGNCYAVTPAILVRRFPEVRSVEMKGKPHFADFNLVPEGWGGCVSPWIKAMSAAYPWLEELRLKRMVVSDDDLELIAESFKDFKVLVLSCCEGFSTDGLAAIASNCSNLKELDLRESDVLELSGHWLSLFPESYTSLESLNIACLSSDFSFESLASLLSRCPNLKSLRLNRTIPLDKLADLLRLAPQLEEFGTGGYSAEPLRDVYSDLFAAFSGCKKLNTVSGLWDAESYYLTALYPVCLGITTLNLSYATIRSPDLIKLITRCPNLICLWVLDYIEDTGLQALATSCKHLQELRVFPTGPFSDSSPVTLTEKGLVSVSEGCLNLNSVLYFCSGMTNAALTTIAKNSPNLVRFRLCILEPHAPDHVTSQPFDVGFGAIVEHCKSLKRLSISGLLTDTVFKHIGTHGKNLEMLSVAFAGNSDLGLHYLLSGCEKLRKLEIRDCPFGEKALLDNAGKIEKMRSLWMSSCQVRFEMCKILSHKMPRLNIEIIDESDSLEEIEEGKFLEKVYIYRTLVGPRSDRPDFVYNVSGDNLV